MVYNPRKQPCQKPNMLEIGWKITNKLLSQPIVTCSKKYRIFLSSLSVKSWVSTHLRDSHDIWRSRWRGSSETLAPWFDPGKSFMWKNCHYGFNANWHWNMGQTPPKIPKMSRNHVKSWRAYPLDCFPNLITCRYSFGFEHEFLLPTLTFSTLPPWQPLRHGQLSLGTKSCNIWK